MLPPSALAELVRKGEDLNLHALAGTAFRERLLTNSEHPSIK